MKGSGAGAFSYHLKGLGIGYSRAKPLLQGLDLSFQEGKLIALIGLNGSGKSTLLKTMAGLIRELEGNCLFNGQALGSFSGAERARRISYVAAGTFAAPLKVKEVLALGRLPYTGWMGRYKAADLRRVEAALSEVGLAGFGERRMEQLSDGERQRAMIARALVQDTPLMLLDEPAAFLDLPAKYELIRILSRIRDAGKTVVYSTHDLETALSTSDTLWVLHQGRIHAGAPEDLGISGVFEAMFAASELHFVVEQQRFRYPVQKRGRLQLKAENDVARIWTQKALERLGFEPGSTGEPILRIMSDGQGFAWTLERDGQARTFYSIQSLAACLVDEN
ncbi:MAG: ATP-binding protein [Bacteroidetes bacterium]|nr:MAG: ATP-binding protein [Bacteroidota bacterium]